MRIAANGIGEAGQTLAAGLGVEMTSVSDATLDESKPWQRYALAIVSVAVVLLLMVLREWPLADLNIRLLLLIAVMLSSWNGGLGPGLLTTLLSVSTIYFYLPHQHHFEIPLNESVRLVEFVVAALLISFLNDRRRRAQSRAEFSQRQAEAATRVRDEFLAAVSHDLRTPLTAVLGWTKILLTRCNDRAATEQALKAIERNARKQLQLIDDLLDVSRISEGQFRLSMNSIDLANVLEGAIDVVRPAMEAKGIQLRKLIDEHLPPVFGDERRLQQVVWNLLSNAIKFTPESGLVKVRLTQVGSCTCLVVKDSGCGIDKDFLPYVFDRFRQEAGGEKRGGLGLGMAIARTLVELHGGTIEVASSGPGLGAQFTVQLPVAGAGDRSRVKGPQEVSALSVQA